MTRPPMPLAVRHALDAELAAARSGATSHERWQAAERAHILSQPWPWPHVRVHASMFRLGIVERDRREIVGQVARLLVAGPGSLSGRYPVGNTGRSDVSMTKPMPLPADLRELLAEVTGT